MAKLSAHGRTLVAEATKEVEVHGYEGQLTLKRRLMSDRTILTGHGGRWTVHGKLKPGVSAEEWVAAKRNAGWEAKVVGALPEKKGGEFDSF